MSSAVSRAGLHYLTVQDVLWINLQLTRKVNHYSFAKLEEGTFYQYAYGTSNSLLAQAARFLPGFVRIKPFEGNNDATAFASLACFLALNGRTLTLSDGDEAVAWFDKVSSKQVDAVQALESATHEAHAHEDIGHPLATRQAMVDELSRYTKTLETLVARA